MPCTECGHILCIERDDHSLLFCPNCKGMDLESEAGKGWRLKWFFNYHFTPQNLTKIVSEYGRTEAIVALLERIDQSSKDFLDENRFPALDYGYIAYIIKTVYENIEYEGSVTEFDPDIDDDVKTMIKGHTSVVKTLKEIGEGFVELERVTPYPSLNPRHILHKSQYRMYGTEYDLCLDRCSKGIIGKTEENREAFNFVSDHIRGVDRTDPDDVETLYDYGDCYYDIIVSLAFISSFNELVSSAYTTFLPDEVTAFQLRDFVRKLDDETDSSPRIFAESTVDNVGEEVFGELWEDAKTDLIMTEQNTNAHPLLFEIDITREIPIRGSRFPYKKSDKVLLYPMYLAGFLRFQMFPLLNNGSQPSGHKLIERITGDRGGTFERQLYEFINGYTEECYFSVKLPGTDPKEVDVLYITEDELVFIEAKYVTPPLNINESGGIKELNDKFNNIVFKETNGNYDERPGGKPFDEKVEIWENTDSGTTFSAENEIDNREKFEFNEDWRDLNTRKFVVSNLVPSFTQKQGVEFLTDIELYKYIKYGEDVFYTIE